MTAKKTDVPDPSAKQIAYSRTAAAYLAVNLLNTAADALMHGHDMRPPRLPRTNPCDDAVTARSLQIIAATAYLAVNLLNTAADALMHGHDMRPPRLPRTNPCDDAVTARSLQIIAATLTDYIHANTTDEQEDGVPPQPDHAERRQKEQE